MNMKSNGTVTMIAVAIPRAIIFYDFVSRAPVATAEECNGPKPAITSIISDMSFALSTFSCSYLLICLVVVIVVSNKLKLSMFLPTRLY